MRSSAYRRQYSSGPIVSPLAWIAAASFFAGLGGYLLFGLSTLR